MIDPIGTLPVFLAVASRFEAARQRVVAFKATLVSFIVLMLFIVAGQVVLEALDISLVAFQIAGGIVLFLFALSMIFGEPKAAEDLGVKTPGEDVAIYPLAMPSLASPGAMLAVVLLTDNNRFSIGHQAMTAGLVAAVLLSALVIMLAATRLSRMLGTSGAAVISRVMGMILAAVAVDNVLVAFSTLGILPDI